jgi:hypothetical protein
MPARIQIGLDKIADIHADRAAGSPIADLAKRYEMSERSIHRILEGTVEDVSVGFTGTGSMRTTSDVWTAKFLVRKGRGPQQLTPWERTPA